MLANPSKQTGVGGGHQAAVSTLTKTDNTKHRQTPEGQMWQKNNEY